MFVKGYLDFRVLLETQKSSEFTEMFSENKEDSLEIDGKDWKIKGRKFSVSNYYDNSYHQDDGTKSSFLNNKLSHKWNRSLQYKKSFPQIKQIDLVQESRKKRNVS